MHNHSTAAAPDGRGATADIAMCALRAARRRRRCPHATAALTRHLIHRKRCADEAPLFPYLLVNIGSGVSMVKVDGNNGAHERVSGTNIGGGTFSGLCRLLTGVTSFDEMLELSSRGNSANVDMLVGDIYGRDYGTIGLSADTIASSFGKVVTSDKKLADYNPAGARLRLLGAAAAATACAMHPAYRAALAVCFAQAAVRSLINHLCLPRCRHKPSAFVTIRSQTGTCPALQTSRSRCAAW
jgi:Fumble